MNRKQLIRIIEEVLEDHDLLSLSLASDLADKFEENNLIDEEDEEEV